MKYIFFLTVFILAGCITDSDSESKAAALTFGVYEHEEMLQYTEAIEGVNARITILSQLEIKTGGAYASQAFMTSQELSLNNLLYMEMKGNFLLKGETVIFSNMLERLYDLYTGQFSVWATPEDGPTDESLIRNITSSTFQTFDDNEWITWTKI